jgi:hypothetical protein
MCSFICLCNRQSPVTSVHSDITCVKGLTSDCKPCGTHTCWEVPYCYHTDSQHRYYWRLCGLAPVPRLLDAPSASSDAATLANYISCRCYILSTTHADFKKWKWKATHNLHLGNRWKWTVNLKLHPLYSRSKSCLLTERKTGPASRTASMMHMPFIAANSYSVGQDFPCLLQSPKFTTSPYHEANELSPHFPPYYININFHISLPSIFRSSSWSFPSSFIQMYN